MVKQLKMPKLGEVIKTPYGLAEVIEIRNWNEVEEGFNSQKEKKAFMHRIEFFLGGVEKYFEFVVKYLEDGEYGVHDWSEYRDNFSYR